jgi:hypothetical protein
MQLHEYCDSKKYNAHNIIRERIRARTNQGDKQRTVHPRLYYYYITIMQQQLQLVIIINNRKNKKMDL